MERLNYFIRRLFLIVPTFLGITFFNFALCQFVPGGPVEQALLRMRGIGAVLAERMAAVSGPVSEDQRKALERHFGFDRPLLERYAKWLIRDRIGLAGESWKYPNKTVGQLIRERFPVSLIFGITSFVLTYLICIPLGVAKAMRHGTRFDLITSVIIFIGYALPPFALGMVLKTLFCGVTETFWDIFPVAGFESPNFASMSWTEQIRDRFMHMFLPVVCYTVGHFAVLTLLMKNSLLDQIHQDYVRAVLARGASRRRAIWGHAFRNALIPIATGFGGILSVMFAGSVLIERVFEIPGMGRLSLDAIMSRDYMLFMGILGATALLGLLGRVLSDLCYVLIDPRITFRQTK